MSIDPGINSLIAAIGTTGDGRPSDSKPRLADITNHLPHQRFSGGHSENDRYARKDPFARFRKRQEQKRYKQQERRQKRQRRRKQQREEGEDLLRRKPRDFILEISQRLNRATAMTNEIGGAGNDSRVEERKQKPKKSFETKNPSMPPPKEETTKLVLLQRKNRLNGYLFSCVMSQGDVSERAENPNQTTNVGTADDPVTVPSAEIHDTPTLNLERITTNREIASLDTGGYHFTNLSDGTPVYTSLPFQPLEKSMLKNDSSTTSSSTTSISTNFVVGEEEEMNGKSRFSQSKYMTPYETSLHTKGDTQECMLSVGRSSNVPIARSSCLRNMEDTTESKAMAKDLFGVQCDEKDCVNEEMHQTNITLIDDFTSQYSPSSAPPAMKTKDNSDSENMGTKEIIGEIEETFPNVKKTQFKDIIGHQSVKLRLDEVLLPLALPASLSQRILTGVRSLPASVFMYGPPGCGKTQLAKAVAGEAQAAFLSIGPSDILSKYVGESEEAVRSAFVEAVRLARNNRDGSKCTVLFFDEIDALGQSRGVRIDGNGARGGVGDSQHSGGYAASDNSSRRVLAELLIQLTKVNDANGTFDSEHAVRETQHDEEVDGDEDGEFVSSDGILVDEDDELGRCGIQSNPNDHDDCSVRIVVIAATNRPEDCDPALIRRFAVQVQVGLPNTKDRRKILKRSMQDIEHKITKTQFSDLSLITDGWSGSDLQNLAREAAMAPVRECIRSAALLKRRQCLSTSFRRDKKRMEQTPCGQARCTGNEGERKTYSSKERGDVHDNSNSDNSSDEAKQKLLDEFRSLRPVNFGDFVKALAFSFSRMYSNLQDSPLAAFGWIDEVGNDGGANSDVFLQEHYDSSSDEEESHNG